MQRMHFHGGRRALAGALAAGLFATGAALAQSAHVTLMSHIDNDATWTSDIWGYSGGGRQIAIIGGYRGTQFYDVTTPTAPTLVKNIPGPDTIWREFKTYSHYAYIVNDDAGFGGRGLAIVDMAVPTAPVLVREVMTQFTTCHEIYIDTDLALCFCVGAGNNTFIYSLEPDPSNPTHIFTFNNFYIHDMTSKNGIGYAAAIFNGFMATLNLSSLPGSLPVMDTIATDDAFTHNVWITDNGHYAYCTDEQPGGHITIVDVSNPNNLVRVGSYENPTAPGTIVHNVYIRGNYAYASWYEAGLEIMDISNPIAPVRAGYYDTYPSANDPEYHGAWGTYPFSTAPNIVYVSDIDTGLYVFRFDPVVGVEDVADPRPFALHPVSANPFKGAALLRFELSSDAPTSLVVFDGSGRRVRTLADGVMAAGAHEFSWDGRDESGATSAPGVYVVQLESNDAAETLKLVKTSAR